MTAYVNAADAIRTAFDCAVIIVHHCGIDGTRPRGHTSLTGTCDAQLATKRDAANNIVVTVEWMKDGPEGSEPLRAHESWQAFRGFATHDAPCATASNLSIAASSAASFACLRLRLSPVTACVTS